MWPSENWVQMRCRQVVPRDSVQRPMNRMKKSLELCTSIEPYQRRNIPRYSEGRAQRYEVGFGIIQSSAYPRVTLAESFTLRREGG